MSQPLGRPQDDAIRTDLMREAGSLVMEKGFRGLSIEAIATRAATTRPAFYRRFDGLPAIILAIIQDRSGTALDQDFDTGSLQGDLEAIQRERVALLGDPLISRSLAGFLDSLTANEKLRHVFIDQVLGPRRAATTAIIHRAMDRGEITSNPDIEWICDLLTGPLVLRAVMPGLLPLDEDLISNSVTSALAALG